MSGKAFGGDCGVWLGGFGGLRGGELVGGARDRRLLRRCCREGVLGMEVVLFGGWRGLFEGRCVLCGWLVGL